MRWFVFSDPSRDSLWGVCNTPLPWYENDIWWFVLSDPSCDLLLGVCNTPLPWYENAMRWFVLSDPSRNLLCGVCNTLLPYRMKKEDLKMFLWCFLRLKMEWKYFRCAFWGSKSSQNAFEVIFEAQNRMEMLLECFLSLKMEWKCFWGTFWGSKSSQNVFEVLFETQNQMKVFLRYFLRLKIESKCFWGAFWGSKWSESVFEVYLSLNMADKETAGHLLLRRPAVKQTFWVLHGTQNAVGNYLLLIETSMRLPWESSWLAKSRTDSMVRALTFFS